MLPPVRNGRRRVTASDALPLTLVDDDELRAEAERRVLANLSDLIQEVRYRRVKRLRGRCPVCRERVRTFRSDAVYCSTRCRVRAHRARRSAAAPAPAKAPTEST